MLGGAASSSGEDSRYERLIESIPYAFYAVDREGRIREANRALLDLLGRSEEELLGTHFAPLVAEEDLPKAERLFQSASADELETAEADLWIRRRDGERRLVRVAFRVVREDGEVVGTHGIVRDVTEERAAGERLLRSEQRLRILLSRVPVILWTVDQDLRFTSGSGAGLEELGLSDDETVGRSLHEYFGTPDPDFPPIRAHRQALEGRPQTYRTEWGDRIYEVRVEPIHGDDGRTTGVIGAALDVTERVKAERQLAEQRVHVRMLFDVAPEAIVLLDPEARVLEANAEFLRLFGYGETEVVGRNVDDLIVPSDRGGEAANLHRRVIGGERISEEAIRRRKDGSLLNVSILGTPLDLGGERRVYAIYRDITERKRLEEQLLHSQRMEAVGQLAGGIAHDFNNILTAILGHARVLAHEVPEGWIREDLMEIESAATRAAGLTRQLLTFSRRQVVERRNVDLNAVVAGMDALLRRLIGEHVVMDTELEPSLPPVLIDPGQLEQVVMNLVLNARDAMPSGGTVSVRTRLGRAGRETTDVQEGASRPVVLEVVDAGIGMKDEQRARMFEPFFTTKRPGEGTGLGLSTVYGIVEQAGGWIDVESAPGEGTRIAVHLPPATAGGKAAAGALEAAGAAVGGHERILLVDDDGAVKEITRRILERHGYSVITAASGEEALDLARSLDAPPDLLLSDIVMPGISGHELATEIRRLFPEVAVLLMSGYSMDLAGDQLETVGLVAKPFDPRTLARRVREALG